jgi:hypothetical protein
VKVQCESRQLDQEGTKDTFQQHPASFFHLTKPSCIQLKMQEKKTGKLGFQVSESCHSSSFEKHELNLVSKRSAPFHF